MNPEQIKQIQERLKTKGLYTGPIDGRLGPETSRAIALEQSMTPQKSEAEIQLERDRVAAEREAQATRSAQEERQRLALEAKEREQGVDPWMQTIVPFGIGAGVGGVYGELTNRGLNKFDEGNARALREIADEIGPTRKLTTSELNRARAAGSAQAAERFAPSGPVGKTINALGRASAYGIPTGLLYNEYRNYQKRADDTNLTETERRANQQVANGLLGTMTGIGVEGGRRFFFPSRPEGAGKALARINTARELARRTDAKEQRLIAREDAARATPVQAATSDKSSKSRPALPGSRRDLLEQAKKYGIQGRSTMGTDELRAAVSNAVKSSTSPRGGAATKLLRSPAFAPIAAAGVAYDAAISDAEAGATGGSVTASDRLAGAGTAAAAGGATYGMQRLINALSPVAKSAIGAAGSMTLPQMAVDMTDYSQDEMAQGRNFLARNLPESVQFGAVEDARQMAQVPERNPQRLDDLVKAAEQDPELASVLSEVIQERLYGQSQQ